MPATPRPPESIVKLLHEHPYPLVVADLEHRTILGGNQAAYELLGRTSPSLDGAPVAEIVDPTDWDAVDASMSALASGALEAYQAMRHFRKGDGQEITVNIWVRVAGQQLALVALGERPTRVPWILSEDRITIAVLVTDHDWTIEIVSSDIETMLGLTPESYKGAPLLGLLQPWDVQKLLAAVGRVTSDGGGATLRSHLRDVEGRWHALLFLVLALDQHSPPRLGIAITDPDANAGKNPDCQTQLASRGSDVVDGADHFRQNASMERFTSRQSEILTRLLRGDRVSDIARDLYLSPSTVRNHLTTIYRRFGVHSQAELLAKLLRGA